MYERLAKQILSSPELGQVLVTEELGVAGNDESPDIIGFLTLTFRYEFRSQSDELVLIGAETASSSRFSQEEMLEAMKEFLTTASVSSRGRPVSGIMFFRQHEETLQGVDEVVVRKFSLKPSEYHLLDYKSPLPASIRPKL